jgi:ATP-dependent DNA helicase RecG
VASPDSKARDNKRLVAFEKSQDGFELAEMDLRLRGPGDLLGTAQSGMPALRIANLSEDGPLLDIARAVAREILSTYPQLSDPQLAKLVQQTMRRYGQSLHLGEVG